MTDNPNNKPIVDFLVIDDQENIRSSIKTMLKSAGHNNIVMVESGKKALTILEEEHVKFVITDWHMPGMDGIELLKIIRKNPDTLDLPVLMVSDESSSQKFAYALEESVDGFLLKPFNELDFLDTLNKITEKKSKISPLQASVNKIRGLMLRKAYQDAIAQGNKLLEEQKENPDILYLVADCNFRIKQYKEAKALLDQLMDNNPTSKIMHLYGKVCMCSRDFSSAIDIMNKACDENPLNLDRRIDVMKACLATGRVEDAEAACAKVLRGDPTDLNLVEVGKTYLKRGNLEKAGEVLLKTLDPIPETASTFNNYALQLRKQGKLKESIKQYENCIKVVPHHPVILLNFGRALMEAEDYKQAVRRLNTAVKKNPDYQPAADLLEYIKEKYANKL